MAKLVRSAASDPFNFRLQTSSVSPTTLPPTKFQYDAIVDKGRRQRPTGILQSEDNELRQEQRRLLVSNARDVQRNFVIAGWMIRKDQDYVSTFDFQSKIGDKAKDRAVESFVRNWSKAASCDVAGRHSLPQMIRLARGRVLCDGDIGIIKLRDGRLQACESDRIRTPDATTISPGNPAAAAKELADVTHGVRTNKAGKALAYAVHNRGCSSDYAPGNYTSFQFDRWIGAQNLYLYGSYDRFDQIRGISPMAAALNNLRDIYEGFEYALAKMKVTQLFGMVMTRSDMGNIAPTEVLDDSSGDPTQYKYKVDFGRGPAYLELDPGEDAKFLESGSPSTQFKEFSEVVIGVCLKALDIPQSFFSEDFTNYSGAREALLLYEQSCEWKRAQIVELLDWIISWRLKLAIIDGDIEGVSIDELKWNWVPAGIPWIDPLKEMTADSGLVQNGFSTTPEIIKKRTGRDYYDLLEEQAAYEKDRSAFGLGPLPYSSKQLVEPDADDGPKANKKDSSSKKAAAE